MWQKYWKIGPLLVDLNKIPVASIEACRSKTNPVLVPTNCRRQPGRSATLCSAFALPQILLKLGE